MARRIRQNQLRESSKFDGLTGLPGRRLCLEMLEEAVAESMGGSRIGVFVIFEIDRFKGINEKFGPSVADDLLRAVTTRLRAAVRGTDKVARLGSDRFAVIGRDLLAPDGPEVFVSKIVKTLGLPYDLANTALFVQFNGGAAQFPTDGRTAEEVIKSAEIALASAVNTEVGKVAYFSTQLGTDQDRRRALQADLERAIACNQLSLDYQPMLSSQEGELVAVEALLRWNHHVYGNVAPREFLPLAEASGQISSIGEWVIQRAAESVSHWNKTLKRPIFWTINVGHAQLRAGGLSVALGNAIRRHNLPPSLLGVEFSEEVLQRKDHHVENELRAIDGIGVRLVLDAFGSAHSSIVDIAQLPLQIIKIAKQLVLDLSIEPSAERTIRAITAMAATLGITTVGVGVEHDEQLATLRECGADWVQGYHLGKPCPKADFADCYRKLPAMRKRLFAS